MSADPPKCDGYCTLEGHRVCDNAVVTWSKSLQGAIYYVHCKLQEAQQHG